LKPKKNVILYLFNYLSVKGRVKTWYTISSSSSKRIGELIIQLGANSTIPRREHLVAEVGARPVIPANQRAGIERAKGVLRVGNVIAVSEAKAVSCSTILVIHSLYPAPGKGDVVSGVLVLSMA
jgi:hypothetical protein